MFRGIFRSIFGGIFRGITVVYGYSTRNLSKFKKIDLVVWFCRTVHDRPLDPLTQSGGLEDYEGYSNWVWEHSLQCRLM